MTELFVILHNGNDFCDNVTEIATHNANPY